MLHRKVVRRARVRDESSAFVNLAESKSLLATEPNVVLVLFYTNRTLGKKHQFEPFGLIDHKRIRTAPCDIDSAYVSYFV